ncbi:MAG: phosphopantothenoylcysteine decarboxylase domain-containing protein [Planctomycetota bacterium]|jgi:phosphopantothenoylcysteine decarboxylase/phosphopantothenate--cysteine ligase
MHILITAGGTREYIDPVRFISNASSGKMGCALARAALNAGHKVTLITAPTTQRWPSAAKVVKAETAAQVFEAVKKCFSRCDCLIMAAAVADYTPVRPAKAKIRKNGEHLTIKLRPTPDILKWAGKHKRKNQLVVGFALEDRAIRVRAQKKLKDKNLDMIVANSPAAIGTDKSNVQIKIAGHKWLKFSQATKIVIAGRLIKLIEEGRC